MTRVAVVCSILNEEAAVDSLLDSLAAQSRPPDEIVLVDGGSRDQTVDVVRRRIDEGAPIRLIELPASTISQARNCAIAAISEPIVAVTDCGVRLAPRWLEALVGPFDLADPPDIVSGFFRPDPRGPFETALGASTLISDREVDPTTFVPSSRSVAFRRAAWQAVGGYPEWLEHSEDVVFDLRLKQHGYRFVFRPDALVHFRPRGSLAAFFRQYRLYARGDGKADLWRRRHAARYLAYCLAPIVLLGGLWYKRLWLVAGVAGVGYLVTPYRRLVPWLSGLPWGQRLIALAWIPPIRVVGDVAKMIGYASGVRWRLRHGRRAG